MVTFDADYLGLITAALFYLALMVLGICCESSKRGRWPLLVFLFAILCFVFAAGFHSGSVYHPVKRTTIPNQGALLPSQHSGPRLDTTV